MANYFQLELDTTPPIINAYLESEVAQTTSAHIFIETNESLLEYQDIYCIDSIGNRFALTFHKFNDTQLYGEIQVGDMALGITSLYIILKDVVGNTSEQLVKYFDITQQISIQLMIDDFLFMRQEISSNNLKLKYNEATTLVNMGSKYYHR